MDKKWILKGASIIRMMNAFLTEKTFKKGVSVSKILLNLTLLRLKWAKFGGIDFFWKYTLKNQEKIYSIKWILKIGIKWI